VKELLEAVARELVDQPGRVSVRESVEDGVHFFDLSVAPEDRGRVIGRNGRTADALRALLDAVAAKRGLECEVEIE
jgi:hypothetical protein